MAAEAPSENGAPAAAKKKTRRGSRGGKNRRKPGTGVPGPNGAEPKPVEAESVEVGPIESEGTIEPEPSEPTTNGVPDDDWGYVPMSEWVDELES